MGGDNFDKSSKGEIIDFYEADRLFREYVESEYDQLILDIHELIKRAASNGETSLLIRKMQGEKIKVPVSQSHPSIPAPQRMTNGFFFTNSPTRKVNLGKTLFSFDQFNTAQNQVCAYFKKLGYDVANANKQPHDTYFVIKWDRVDRRKFP